MDGRPRQDRRDAAARAMKTLERYIARTLIAHFAVALGALLAIFSVMMLMQELADTGTGSYGLRDAAWFVLLTLPNEAYWLFPAAALLGTVNGLGALASSNEIIAMQSAGISRLRLTGAVLLAAGILAALAVGLGEGVAGPLARHAHMRRSVALSGGLGLGTATGIWARDGSRIVNVRAALPDGSVRDLYVFDFQDRQLRTFTYAQNASWDQGKYTLQQPVEQEIRADGATVRRPATGTLTTRLGRRQLSTLFLPPEELSLLELSRTVDSLRERGEDARLHEHALWRRASMPLIAAVMVFCAVPLVLEVRQRSTVGQRVVAGALIGIGFQMFNDTFARFGVNYGLSPILTAFLPAAIVLAAALWRNQRASHAV
jgi:lipopolysaccharide export system permease protein